MLKSLRRFPGAKTVMLCFLLLPGQLCFAKNTSSGRQSPLRIIVGGAAAPSSHPGAFALVELRLYFFAFSLARLSFMIFMCSAVMRVTLFSLAQETQPLSTTGKNTLGTPRMV